MFSSTFNNPQTAVVSLLVTPGPQKTPHRSRALAAAVFLLAFEKAPLSSRGEDEFFVRIALPCGETGRDARYRRRSLTQAARRCHDAVRDGFPRGRPTDFPDGFIIRRYFNRFAGSQRYKSGNIFLA